MVAIIRIVGALKRPHVNNATGWTVFPPKTAGAADVYVADAAHGGLAINNGNSPTTPKLTLQAGYDVLVSGRGDRLHVKADSVFTESFPTWYKSGKSADDPMIVMVYGSGARPIVGGQAHGWNTGQAVSHFAMRGIDFRPSIAMNGQDWTGIRSLHQCNNLLFEDCITRAYGGNVLFQTGANQVNEHLTDVRMRRCIIRDAADGFISGNPPQPNDHSEGVYSRGVNGLTFEDCVFSHNGWNLSLSPPMPRNIFSHNLYVSNENTDVQVLGCLFADASSDGHQMRGGGVSRDCVYMGNALAASWGQGGDNGYANPLGVPITMENFLILDGQDIDHANGVNRGWGVKIGNISGGTITDGVLAGVNEGHLQEALEFVGDLTTGSFYNPNTQQNETNVAIGVQNVTVDNYYVTDWGGNVLVNAGAHVNGCTVKNSTIPAFSGSNSITKTNNTSEGVADVDIAWYRTRRDQMLARPRGVWTYAYSTQSMIDHAKAELGI